MSRVFNVLIFFILTFESTLAQDCETRNTYLPVPDKYGTNSYGSSIDVFEDFMVVGAANNDSLSAFAGLAYVYRLNASQQWERIAELAPSDPQRSLRFGDRVGIYGTTIAISANSYDDAGVGTAKLYIFERSSGGEWVSGTETYQLKDNQSLGNFRIRFDEIVTAGSTGLTIYNKTAGAYSKTQTIAAPLDRTGSTASFGVLDVGDDLIAVGVDQFRHSDGGSSVVFLYEKAAGVYPTVPVQLRSSAPGYSGFGRLVAIDEGSVFVSSPFTQLTPAVEVQTVQVFEKPVTGWANSTETALITGTGYVLSDRSMIVDDDYILISGIVPDILGFKKTGADWSSGVVEFNIQNPGPGAAYGSELAQTSGHFILGGTTLSAKTPIPEKIFDYHRPTHDWENIVAPDQEIKETSINAAEVLFGFSMATHENLLFIGAPHDDENSNNGGAVYVFDKTKPPGTAPLKIFQPIKENSANFGHAIAAGPDLLFISAVVSDSLGADGSFAFTDMGRVYVYRKVGGVWKYTSQIIAPQVVKSGGFGQAIQYLNGYLAISDFPTNVARSRGHLHMFKKESNDTFAFLGTLEPSENIGDTFGRKIILTDSLLVVGTGGGETRVGDQSRVFIYRKKGEWKNATEDASLLPQNKILGDTFGASISMDGEYIVVGSPTYPTVVSGVTQHGKAYIFKMPKGGWKGTVSDIAQLLPSNPMNLSYFGNSVIIDHDDIFVGAPHSLYFQDRVDFFTNNDNTIKPGTVYHYVREGDEWTSTNQEKRPLQAEHPEYLDGFGYDMLLDGRILYVSSIFDNTTVGFISGSVQWLGLPPTVSRVPELCVSSAPVALRYAPVGGQWTGIGVNASGVFNPSTAGAGSHVIKYEVGGCMDEITIDISDGSVTVNDVSPESTTKCVSAPVSLTFDTNIPPTASLWMYKPKENEQFKELDSLKETIITKTPGYYSVTVRQTTCPDVSRSFVVKDEEEPIITIDPADIVCDNKPVQLNATPKNGTWSGGNITSSGNIGTTGMSDGKYEYQYTYTSPLSCVYSKGTSIQVDKLTVPVITKDNDRICGNAPVVLTASNVDAQTLIHWRDEHGNNLGDKKTLRVDDAGDFLVVATKHLCVIESEFIHVDAMIDSLFVPNVFTPNDDGYNDFFQVEGSDLNEFNMLVYNRYGNQVYESSDPSFKWKAAELSAGTYFWRVTYENCSGDVKEEKGWVQLVR